MEHVANYKEAEYDAQLDRLVDTWNVSYDEARELLGEPPYEIVQASITSHSELGTCAIDAVLAEYDLVNEAGAAWNHELTPYLPFRLKSVEQVKIDVRGRALVRAAID